MCVLCARSMLANGSYACVCVFHVYVLCVCMRVHSMFANSSYVCVYCVCAACLPVYIDI